MTREELDFSFPQFRLLRLNIQPLRKIIHNLARTPLLRLHGHHLRVFFDHMKGISVQLMGSIPERTPTTDQSVWVVFVQLKRRG
jgi:hypothetical protein